MLDAMHSLCMKMCTRIGLRLRMPACVSVGRLRVCVCVCMCVCVRLCECVSAWLVSV